METEEKQIHECWRKHGKLIDVMTDGFGNIYCKGCRVKVSPEVVREDVLDEINRKQKDRRS